MKLLFTISLYYPYISGLTVSPARIAENLIKRGYIIRLLTTLHQNGLKEREIINGVEIVRVPYLFRISKGFIMPYYFWHAFNEVRKADVVIVNLPQFEGFIPAVFAKLLRKKLVSFYHCEVKLQETIFNMIFGNLLHLANFISLMLADKVITYTQDYASRSKLLPNFIDKLTFIYPPIAKLQVDEKFKKQLQCTPSIKKTRYIIGVAARIASEKGIEYLIEAIPDLKKELGEDFIIIFAGPKEPIGEEKYWTKLSPLICKYEKHITFLGKIPSEGMGAFYSILDVLVLPSINSTEAFGMVQVEAMLCGVPVVVTDLSGVRIPVQKTQMGEIAKIKDVGDLADKIVRVLTNRKKYIKKRSFIERTFSLNETINKFQELLKQN